MCLVRRGRGERVEAKDVKTRDQQRKSDWGVETGGEFSSVHEGENSGEEEEGSD